MKKLLNSSSLLIGLILVFIAVLSNKKSISSSIEQAIANVIFKNNHAEQWRVKPGSIYDGDTLRVVRGNEEELKIRFCPKGYRYAYDRRECKECILHR